MTTKIQILTAKTLEEALANKGMIGESVDGVIVLRDSTVQYFIPANEIKVIAKDGEKELT